MNNIKSQHSKILLVEDETNLGKTLSEYLLSLNFATTWAKTAQEAREQFENTSPEIVLMDIGLPDGNGIDLAKEFQNTNRNFILLFLSALNDPETKLKGLELGANDYITKPFALKELTLRLKRIMENSENRQSVKKEITHGPLKIWFNSFEVQDATGNVLNLSQKECEILQLLYQNKSIAVTRDEIIEKVWGINKFPSNRTVDNYIVKLRKWCETDTDQHITINSIRSVGYKLSLKK